MAELDDVRRNRAELERQRNAIAAELAAEQEPLARGGRGGIRPTASSQARLKALRAKQAANDARMRAIEARLEKLRAETATTPVPTPATSETVPDHLGPVPADVPLLLLPVRLETRFHGAPPSRELLVRIYPDDIHIDTHEPGLTSDELEAGKRYWRQAWTTNEETDKAAWNQIAGMFGAERAAWIAQLLTPTNAAKRPQGTPAFPEVDQRPSSWSRAARATTLPDRWIALGYVGTGRVFAVTGAPIPDLLQVGPAPDAEDDKPDDPSAFPLDEGMRWLVDFETAVKLGMALRIPLPEAAQNGLSRLVVVGAKRSLGPDDSGSALAALIDAQHFTRGVGLIPPGAPTNNTTQTISGLDSRDAGHEQSFASERSGPLFGNDERADGANAATALGVPAARFQQVAHAGEKHLAAAHAMNTTLWPATWGYYLEQRLAGIVNDAELTGIRRHFVEFVRAGGPLPALRVGRQPYGLLPVTALERWRGADSDDADARSQQTLLALRDVFRRAAGVVPHMRSSADVDQNLLSILRMRSSSKGHQVRHLLGPLFVSNFFNFAGPGLPQGWWAAHRAIVKPPNIGGITPTMPQSLATPAPHLDPMSTAPRVAETDGKPDYLEKLAAQGYRAALEHRDAPPEPRPLLYLLSRHALLLAYISAANRICRRAGMITPEGHLEPELIGIDPNAPSETIWQRLEKTVPVVTGQQSLGDFLDDRARAREPDVRELADLRTALRELAQVPVADLEHLLTETLDLATHRFDAWVTSLATRRLAQLRAKRSTGVQIGGYCWLENLQPSAAAVSNGFIHVPSLDHAGTAAVLASGYLSHRNAEGPSPFAIDLSSDRVRNARWLLQGVRAGQTLGALLGYRIERGLQDANLARHIDEVRKRFTFEGALDGAKLLEERRNNTALFQQLPRAIATDFGMVNAVFVAIDRELDALGDLLMAEGVFQVTRGNFERAGQTLSSVMNGQSLPEPESMDTPRTGVVVTHRIIKFLEKPTPAKGKGATPRAVAEPCLNRWMGEILGNLSRVQCRAEYTVGERNVERVLSLSELALAPIDLVATSGENLETLVLAQARKKRPARVPATAEVRLIRERDPAWNREIIGWSEFLFVTSAARKLLASLQAVAGNDLIPADQPDASSVDVAELRKRADAAVAKLKKTAGLKSPGSALATFGIFGTDTAVLAEARDRLARVQSAVDFFKRAEANPSQEIAHDSERIRIVFGAEFPVLPFVKAGNSAELKDAFAASDETQGGDPLAASSWLERTARVRAPVARFQEVTRSVAALHHIDPPCAVAQVPFVEDERWVALPAEPGAITSGKLSLVASGAVPDFKSAFCGVVIDEWTEMVPNARETTGVVFQFDRPAARPPQACLLAVPPETGKPWDLDTLEATILETLELTKLRLVDQDALTELDHYLPALCFTLNAANDTVSTDFR